MTTDGNINEVPRVGVCVHFSQGEKNSHAACHSHSMECAHYCRGRLCHMGTLICAHVWSGYYTY